MTKLVLLILATATSGDGGGAALTVVRLKPRATIQADIVTVADVAELSGPGAEALAGIPLGPAPAEGETKSTGRDELCVQLRRHQVDLRAVEIAGAGRVALTRQGGADAGAWERVIADMILEHVRRTGPWPAERVHARVEGRVALEFLETHRPDRWDLLVPPRWRVGAQPVVLEATIGDKTARFDLQATIDVDQPIVVATRPIARGEKIEEGMVAVGYRKLTPGGERTCARIEEVLGKEAARSLSSGQALTPRDARTEPIVFRGSPVTVWIRQGTVALQVTGIAQEDGGLGDWIEIMNPTSKRKFEQRARVLGPQLAELPPAPAGPRPQPETVLSGGTQASPRGN